MDKKIVRDLIREAKDDAAKGLVALARQKLNWAESEASAGSDSEIDSEIEKAWKEVNAS